MPASQKLTVFKVSGETNTDDLSPAPDAWSRPDIPLHALAMLKNPRPGITPEEAGARGPVKFLETLRAKGNLVAYVGDVVGTGSSRKSATNSVLWFTGEDIPFVPNKRFGGVCASVPRSRRSSSTRWKTRVRCRSSWTWRRWRWGDEIELKVDHATARVTALKNGKVIAESQLKTPVILDEVRAGGRISAHHRARPHGQGARGAESAAIHAIPVLPQAPADSGKGFTLAQKMVGRACGLPEGKGVRPGTYCEPRMTTVGSQDTTGPMTRDELKDLACLGFSADLVMQSFCHTAAYPKLVDVKMHRELPGFISTRGGISLRPGRRRVIHSWLNRLLLAGYRRHRRRQPHAFSPSAFPSPPAPGLVAFAAATGVMPLDMPESVLVRFKGKMQPGVTLRDLVNAIPLYAIRQGLLTVEKQGKKNLFSGRILEIEGLPDLKVEQAFELTDASAERSAGRLRGASEQGADRGVHELQHHADEVDDRQRL